MNKRYDFIRKLDPVCTKLDFIYNMKEDLSKFGGPVTILRQLRKEFGNNFDPDKVADELEEFVEKAKKRLDRLGKKYGWETIIKVD